MPDSPPDAVGGPTAAIITAWYTSEVCDFLLDIDRAAAREIWAGVAEFSRSPEDWWPMAGHEQPNIPFSFKVSAADDRWVYFEGRYRAAKHMLIVVAMQWIPEA